MVDANIIFPNVHEFMRRGMDANYKEDLLEEWRNIAAGYGEIAMFWGGDRKLILTPKRVNESFIEFNKDLLGYKEICTVVPEKFTSDTSEDFLRDSNAFNSIVQYTENKNINVLSWGATEGLYKLKHRLSKENPMICFDELIEEENYWTSVYYDSKVGFRQMCLELQRDWKYIHSPRSYICEGLDEVLFILKSYHKKKKACVIKANNGAGGFGNILITKELIHSSYENIKDYIWKSIKELPYFNNGLILVEDFIDVDYRKSENSNVRICFMSGVVDKKGNNKIIASGVDIRDESDYYSGAYMGKNMIPEDLDKELRLIMSRLGDRIAEDGYLGHWGVNFMIDSEKRPMLIELNPRRCGESHIHSIGERLYGEKWMDEVCIKTRLPLNVEILCDFTIDEVLEIFYFLNKIYRSQSIIIIPTQLSWLYKKRYQGIGYAIFAPKRELIEKVDLELLQCLDKIGIKASP